MLALALLALHPAMSGPAAPTARIQLAYFVPRDREPVKSYEEKIGVVMGIVSEVYRDDLKGKGYRTDGLSFIVLDERPQIKLVRGDRDARYYNNAPAYDADEQWKR